jgi:TonB family protein
MVARLFCSTLLAICMSSSADGAQPIYAAEDGVTLPRPIYEVSPPYTSDAMQRRIEGIVRVEVIVEADGTIGNVKVTRSLDRYFGLDNEARTAAAKWRFVPGRKDGTPVAVRIWIDFEFKCACVSAP